MAIRQTNRHIVIECDTCSKLLHRIPIVARTHWKSPKERHFCQDCKQNTQDTEKQEKE